MYFPGKHTEVVYILVYIKLNIGTYMDSGHYVCGVLDYNTVRWWNCDDDTITYYSGYLYIKETFLHLAHIFFELGKQYPKILQIL